MGETDFEIKDMILEPNKRGNRLLRKYKIIRECKKIKDSI